MDDILTKRIRTARFAGFLYLMMVIQAPIALLYLPSQIFVEGDPAATTNNILAHEFNYRLSIFSQLTSTVIFLLLALVLRRLLEVVNQSQAQLMLILVLVQVPVVFVLETLTLTSLFIVKNEILQTLSTDQKQRLVLLLLEMHSYGLMILEVFWGLWLIPFGLLVYHSQFSPRILGICLFIGAAGWIIDIVTFLLFPAYLPLFSKFIMAAGAIGEFPIMFWLLIRGVKRNTQEFTKVAKTQQD
jgi:hypothetical protein